MRTLPLACRSGWLPFNSFEDETNLWKEIRLHNKRVLSIPLRMKQILRLCTQTIYINYLSIPLRMKPQGAGSVDCRSNVTIFQFLWGWNNCSYPIHWITAYILSIPLRMKLIFSVKEYTKNFHLSISLRMKPYWPFRRMTRFWTFNSFEDETKLA